MNDPHAPATGGTAVAEPTKIGNTVIPEGGLSFEDTQKAIETDPVFAEMFLKDATAHLATEAGIADVSRETPAVKQETTTDTAATAAPATGGDEADIDIKVKPSWLGTYGVNRTPDEAVREMWKGNQEKDKHIDYLSKVRIPEIETALEKEMREKAELAAEKDRLAKRAKELEEAVEASKKNGTQPAATGATGTPPPAATAIEIPEIKPMPAILEGDDQFDPEKMKAYNKAVQEHIASTRAHDAAMQKKEMQERLDEIRKGFETKYGDLDKKTQEAKQFTEKMQTELTAAEQEDARIAAINAEYNEINAIVDANPVIFGQRTRPVQEIESDRINFLTNLAHAAGVTGGIYSKPHIIRPEVLQAEAMYYSNDPAAQKIKEVCSARGIVPPPDSDILMKAYAVRSARNEFQRRSPITGQFEPIPYSRAIEELAKQDAAFDAARIQAERVKQNAGTSAERYAAAAATSAKVASEASPATSKHAIDVNSIPTSEFLKMTEKDVAMRTPYEKEVIKAVCREKGLPPMLYGETA